MRAGSGAGAVNAQVSVPFDAGRRLMLVRRYTAAEAITAFQYPSMRVVD